MSLNIEINPISSDEVTTVSIETISIEDTDQNLASGTTSYNFTTDNPWIVPRSVKVWKGATTDEAYTDGDKATTVTVTDHVGGKITATFASNTSTDNFLVQYQYFTADSLRRYIVGAVPTTLRFRNDETAANIVVAESDDGANWLQVGGEQVAAWDIANFGRVTQQQLRVASTSGGRLIGSPISAI